jgi:hypothetical protein
MNRPIQSGLALAVLLVFSGAAHPQSRGFHNVNPPPAAHAQRVTPPATSRPGTVVTHGSSSARAASTTTTTIDANGNAIVNSTGAPLSVQDLLNPFPSPGFDFTHLAAINRDLDVKALIDPITQGRLAIAERLLRESPQATFFPFFTTGSPAVIIQSPEQQQPQPPIVILQQVPAATPASAAGTEAQAAPQSEETQPALPDVGEFTLVMRDGTQVPAVAFTRKADQIVYITKDGNRRSVPVANLDTSATQRVNEERGTAIQFPL